MVTRKLTYAMVGGAKGSFIGPIHRAAIRIDDLATLVAGCFSRDPERNFGSGAKLEVPVDRIYGDWRELIAAEAGKVDFLVICTTNETHYPIAKAALTAGMDVVCEKPLSLTAKEAAELERLAKRKGAILMIPFTYTGFPMVKLARDLVRRGELGHVDKIVMEYQQGSFRKIDFAKPLDKHNSWKMNPKIAGPSCVVADIGVHAFTLVEYVTGLETKSLLADLSSFAPGNRLDDDASLLMRMDGGAKACVMVSKVATGEENGMRLRVYGDKASLFWEQERPNYLSVKYPFKPEMIFKRNAPYVADCSARSKASSRIPAGHHEGFIEALTNIYDEFCAALVSRRAKDHPGAREGVRSMRFVDAALKSAKAGGKWTKV